MHRLENGEYVQLPGEPLWLPEIGLGLGRALGTHRGWTREWLYWYDAQGNRLLAPEELALQEYQRAEQEHQRAEALAAQLRALGVDPDRL